MRFLTRTLKEDSIGLFVYYGGFRIRPQEPAKTRFRMDEEVALTHTKKYYYLQDSALVFRDRSCYEVWAKKKTRPR